MIVFDRLSVSFAHDRKEAVFAATSTDRERYETTVSYVALKNDASPRAAMDSVLFSIEMQSHGDSETGEVWFNRAARNELEAKLAEVWDDLT